MFKDEVSENTLKKRREYYLKHGVKNVFPSGLLESSSLDITTPYMLRNDGELLKCGDYHPYIKSYRKESLEETIKYLKNHNSFLKWFYENTLNEEVKNIISNLKFTQEEIDRLWYLTNQEFCRVRTSNYRYKIGGNNGEIYFRLSSTNENWFDLIWNVCVKFIHSIDYVTIMKDPQPFGKQFDYIKIKDTKINKLPIKDFIELDGEPLVESQAIKEPFDELYKTSENLNEAKNIQTISNDKNKEFYKVKSSGEIGKKITIFSNYIVLELNSDKCETYQLFDVEVITINSPSDITTIDNSSLQPIPREIEIKTTKQFDSDCKDLKLLDKKDEIKEYLYSNKPDASLGGGLYKIRVRIGEENRGQSGSYRVIFFYKKGTICYILTIYAKNQKDNITEKELKELKKYIEKIIEVD